MTIGVPQKIPDHLMQVDTIHLDSYILGHIEHKSISRYVLMDHKVGDKRLKEQLESQPLRLHPVAPRQLEDVPYHAIETLSIIANDSAQPLPTISTEFFLQQITCVSNRRQRVAYFVGDIRREPPERGKL